MRSRSPEVRHATSTVSITVSHLPSRLPFSKWIGDALYPRNSSGRAARHGENTDRKHSLESKAGRITICNATLSFGHLLL